jgi:hypothetical protein
MLAQRVKQWNDEIREQGRKEGREEDDPVGWTPGSRPSCVGAGGRAMPRDRGHTKVPVRYVANDDPDRAQMAVKLLAGSQTVFIPYRRVPCEGYRVRMGFAALYPSYASYASYAGPGVGPPYRLRSRLGSPGRIAHRMAPGAEKGESHKEERSKVLGQPQADIGVAVVGAVPVAV